MRSSARGVIVVIVSDDHFEVKVADLVSDDGSGDAWCCTATDYYDTKYEALLNTSGDHYDT